MLEAALRTLERDVSVGTGGAVVHGGWGPSYSSSRSASPRRSRSPQALSDFELPSIDDYDLCLHLASDDEQRLAAVEGA